MVFRYGVTSALLSITSLLLYSLLFVPNAVNATALTYKIDANEKACFYTWIDKVGEKMAFYFAVSLMSPLHIDFRYKLAARSISTMKSKILIKKSSWMGIRKDRATLYLLLNKRENTPFAFRMI